MGSSNLEVIKKAYADFVKGDAEAVIAIFHEHVVFNEVDSTTMQQQDAPQFKRLEGKEGAITFFQKVAELQQHVTFDVQNVFGDGTHFMAFVHEVLIWKPTGKTVDTLVLHKWEMSPDGKALRFQAFPDTAKMLAAMS